MEPSDKTEYLETGQLFRQYTGFLISIMQHFIAGNGLLFIGLTYVSKDNHPATLSQFLIAFLGFFGCLGSWIVQLRTFRYWTALLNHAQNIDKSQNTNLYLVFHKTSKSKKRIRSAHFARAIYLLFAVFWLVVLLKLCGVEQIHIAV